MSKTCVTVASPRSARRTGVPGVIAALASALVLSACQMNHEKHYFEYKPIALEQRHPIRVEQGETRLAIHVPDRGGRLPDEDKARVQKFAMDHKAEAHGALIVARPLGGPNEVSAAGAVASIQRVLRRAGVPARAVSYRAYQVASAEAPAPVVLSYERFQATVEDCDTWNKNLAVTYSNHAYPSFGCAYQKNLAAMVANPNDFVTPRTPTAPDAIRRDNVAEAYRKGESTISERNADETGRVSQQEQSR